VASTIPFVGDTMTRLQWRRGPGDEALGHRLTEARVEPAEVPGGRAAGLEGGPERGHRLGGQEHEALLLVGDQVHAPVREVDVAVDQPRHDGAAAEIHDPHLRAECALLADVDDLGALDQEGGVAPGRTARAVDEHTADQCRSHSRSPFGLTSVVSLTSSR
jgi:hypothetical protein